MIGAQDRWQEDLFVAGPLSSLIPDDHVLKQVDKVLDLSWLRPEVADCYSETMGRPSIDPESALRLMLAGYFQGIIHDRKLMREAQVNLAIRWFAGFRLHEKLPEHSSLTKIRQRWGPERFKKVFQKTVQMCIDAGLVNGETVHIDSTLIRADVSWESLTTEYADKTLKENRLEDIHRFKYDSRNMIVRCPRCKILRRSSRTEKGWIYRAANKDCSDCPLKSRCISSTAKVRIVLITDGYESLLRARRRWQRRDETMRDKYKRHKWRVEGVHGEAKTQHGLRRAVRRGLENVSIQVYITAAVMNLKRLAAFLLLFFGSYRKGWHFSRARYLLRLTISRIICKWGKICFCHVLAS